MKQKLKIGVVSTRLAGTDGVSLEARKWQEALSHLGHECYGFCGETDWSESQAHTVPEAAFFHPEIRRINRKLFFDKVRDQEVTRTIGRLREHLADEIRQFNSRLGIDILLVENALSLPMNLPLGLALTDVIAEKQIRTIAHHHDFWWERERFLGSVASDYLASSFPANTNSITHIVINSVAQRNLAFRTGLSARLIPNVMDFETATEESDGYADDLKSELGLREHEHLILQPTRIVPRKRIEKAIELVRKMGDDCVLVITHHDGDEGEDYTAYLRDFAELLGARVLMRAGRFGQCRARDDAGRKIYSLQDAYRAADLVTYCSKTEGFGNAFLETIYHRRPLLMSAYEIFSLDILPKGFRVLAFRDFIPHAMVRQARRILDDPASVEEWLDGNYELGRRYYSMESLEKKLDELLEECVGNC